jgi:alkanesulfonate monooxygenase SsuD/methylene tetrahydromethanopterin reductase-like flavin-dependent oxidoreductase (luciferase family)
MTQRRRPLEVGIVLPTWEGGMDGSTAGWADLREMVIAAEAVGFDSIWISDNLLYRTPDGRAFGVREGWSVLTAVAAVTSRVQIGSIVTSGNFRNPALVAKMADTLDEISGGRLTLGLGAGDNELEHTAFGLPWERRVSRFAESLQIIRTLLRTGVCDFEGDFFTLRDCELRPRGPRPAGVPIMIGSRGAGPRLADLIARYADIWNGWLAFKDNDPASARVSGELIDASCRAIGRDPGDLQRFAPVSLCLPGEQQYYAGFDMMARVLQAPADTLAEALRLIAAQGISQVQVFLGPATTAGITSFGRVLEELDR